MINLKRPKKLTPPVAERYAKAIDQISQHYSNETGTSLDIYQIKDTILLNTIHKKYKRDGKFEDFGDKYKGLYRAAISAYVEYFEQTEGSDISNSDNETNFSISDGTIKIKKNSAGRKTITISLTMEETKE
jgi:hypothetical protein